MSGLAQFVLASLALLLTPGPTNTLLTVAGATRGFRAASPLLAAELGGYGVSVTVLALAIGPTIAAHVQFGWALRLACALYLAYLAIRLWRRPPPDPHQAGSREAVHFRRVLVATLLNPKGLVFAFAILPGDAAEPAMPLRAMLLAGLIPLCGAAWIWLGTALRRGTASSFGLLVIHRIGACVLAGFAAALTVSGLLR